MILKRLLGAQAYKTFKKGIWSDHPILAAGLGVCSALAITNKVENAVAMSAGVTFVLVATALIVSTLKTLIPLRARIITYMVTIASFVIIVDRFLQAFYPGISKAVGPYVGLIITNCIIMGRAEAFFIQNNVYHSVVDAIANGLSYSYTLIIVAIVREVLGFGTLLNMRVMPDGWENWVVMSMAPGAFFLLGIAIWISKTLTEVKPEDEGA